MSIACSNLVYCYLAALLTKFKPSESGKAVLRPYTPVNDEGIKR